MFDGLQRWFGRVRKVNRMRDGYIWDKGTGWYGSVGVFELALQFASVCNFVRVRYSLTTIYIKINSGSTL